MLTVLSNRIQINLQINIVMCMLNVLEIMDLDKKEAGFFPKILNIIDAYSKSGNSRTTSAPFNSDVPINFLIWGCSDRVTLRYELYHGICLLERHSSRMMIRCIVWCHYFLI